MHCSRCSKAALVEIRMHVGERELTFRRCGRCEAQSWETADGPIPLAPCSTSHARLTPAASPACGRCRAFV